MTFSIHAFAATERVPAAPAADRLILEVRGLSVAAGPDRPLVEDLWFSVAPGETLAIVGESGCGKSLTSLAIMGLLPDQLNRHRSGEIRFEGEDLARLSPRALRRIRGNRLAMVFQEPMTALNPVMTVGSQIVEVLRQHRQISRSEARARALALLEQVRLPDAAARLDDYPHRLSGGMRQRVMIAMAMACGPSLIIADEPTTALDVTVQAQILDLLKDLQCASGQSLVLISHDLDVVAEVADRMVVMYAGQVVEEGTVGQVISSPRHPYSAGLIAARPKGSYIRGGARLTDILGAVPAPDARPTGCLFAPRCSRATDICIAVRPSMTEADAGRAWRCHHPIEEVA